MSVETMTPQLRSYYKKLANQKCADCGKPNNNMKSRCEPCLEKIRIYRRKYVQEHPIDKKPFYYKWKAEGKCPTCGTRPHADKHIQCDHCLKRSKIWMSRTRKKLKVKLMQILTGQQIPTCANCQCSDIRVLEIHHVNGGGRQDYLTNRFHTDDLFRAILVGKRNASDYGVLCKVCNMMEYAERIFGLKWSVQFVGGNV